MSEYEKNTLTLSKPIQAHGETVTVLTLREPTGKDVRELGYPYQLGQDDAVKLLAGVTAKYLSRLADIPLSSVDTMSPADLNAAGWQVAGFFFPGSAQKTSSRSILTVPTIGGSIRCPCSKSR